MKIRFPERTDFDSRGRIKDPKTGKVFGGLSRKYTGEGPYRDALFVRPKRRKKGVLIRQKQSTTFGLNISRYRK